MNNFLHEFRKPNFVCSQNVSEVFLFCGWIFLILVVMKLEIIIFYLQGLWFGAYFISEWKLNTHISYIKNRALDTEQHKSNCILLARNTAKFLVYCAARSPWPCRSNILFIKVTIYKWLNNGTLSVYLVGTKIKSQISLAILSLSRLIWRQCFKQLK